MRRLAIAFALFTSAEAFSQTPAKEPDALQALLTEVHQLRQDIEAVTVASQRVQIALYSLQMQDAAVARTQQRLDAVRNKCSGAVANKEHLTVEIQRVEAGLASGKVATNELPDLQRQLEIVKKEQETQSSEVATCQAAEAEASGQLRNDQAKLAELQDRIERLDKTLEKLGGPEK
jgi:chromosome segregation ATPase